MEHNGVSCGPLSFDAEIYLILEKLSSMHWSQHLNSVVRLSYTVIQDDKS